MQVFFEAHITQWKSKETLAIGKEIGYTINSDGVKRKAYNLTIHYSKTGTHAVPDSRWWKK